MIRVKWHRALAIYALLALLTLGIGLILGPPGHILQAIGVCLIAGFVPLIMLVYFIRGYLGIQ